MDDFLGPHAYLRSRSIGDVRRLAQVDHLGIRFVEVNHLGGHGFGRGWLGSRPPAS